jgi:sugar/nucleoside kinase (ribokinase family)
MTAVDTLGAGGVFHGGFALALAETGDLAAALRFAAAAVAALKCTRFGVRCDPRPGGCRGAAGAGGCPLKLESFSI